MFWDGENSWFAGVVRSEVSKGVCYSVEYDDGDEAEETLAEIHWRLSSKRKAGDGDDGGRHAKQRATEEVGAGHACKKKLKPNGGRQGASRRVSL